jgi:hypothetical protein
MRHSLLTRVLTIAALLLAISASRGSAADHLYEGFITGTIRDAQTGLPVSGAGVALQWYFAVGLPREMFTEPTATDSNGKYRIGDLVPGHYAVIVYVPGYAANRAYVDVHESQGSISNVSLKPLVTVATNVTTNGDGSQNVNYVFSNQSWRELIVAVWGYGCTVSTTYCNSANTRTSPADTTSKSRNTFGVHPASSIAYSFTKGRNDALSAGFSYCVFTSADSADAREAFSPDIYRQPDIVADAALRWISFDIASWAAGNSDTHPCRTAVMSPVVDWP